MEEICTDNRFKIIAEYKQKLVEATNIETSPEEMAVIDDILFRFWQMGWLNPNKTNADRFRAKTDQELAKTFEDFGVCPPHPCPYSDTDKPLTRDDCLECHLEWLKAEVKEWAI